MNAPGEWPLNADVNGGYLRFHAEFEGMKRRRTGINAQGPLQFAMLLLNAGACCDFSWQNREASLNHKISQNMRPIEAALTHAKARNESPNGYNRFPVPDDKVAWDVSYPAYQPNQFTAPSVLANDVSLKKDGWADEATPQLAFARRGVPQDSNGNAIRRDAEGFPMNPAGRTGTRGRGLLGKWGPNFAADPIVTRVNPKTGELEMLAIRRKDNGQWAIPGGMVDAGEMVSATLAREFEEEAGIRLDMTDARSV